MANVNDDKKLKQTMAEEPVAKPILYGNLTDKNSTAAKDLITQEWGKLQQVGASNPGAYDWNSDADYGMANDYLGQYQNRDPFSYDFNADALYQQYKDQYINQGKMAMMDTMGQAAAMTGGYGNSYAQSVGQQAYNQYLGQLNEVMPELYGMAYDRYNQEGQEMLNMYDIYMSRANDNYGRHMDAVDLWKNDYAIAKDNYDTLYNEYVNAYNQKYAEEENEKSRAESNKANAKNELITLIANGYDATDSELAAVGLTKEQAKIYAGSNSKSVEYEKLLPGTDAYGIVQKAINGATSLEELNEITKEYIRIYGEDAIKGMAAFQKRLRELKPKQQNQTPTSNNIDGYGGINLLDKWKFKD